MPRVPFAALGVVRPLCAWGCANLEDEIDAVLDDDDEPRTYAFECDGDREFRARVSSDREEVVVDVRGERYELDLTDRDEGDRVYTNDDGVQLTVGSDGAYLRIPGEFGLPGLRAHLRDDHRREPESDRGGTGATAKGTGLMCRSCAKPGVPRLQSMPSAVGTARRSYDAAEDWPVSASCEVTLSTCSHARDDA